MSKWSATAPAASRSRRWADWPYETCSACAFDPCLSMRLSSVAESSPPLRSTTALGLLSVTVSLDDRRQVDVAVEPLPECRDSVAIRVRTPHVGRNLVAIERQRSTRPRGHDDAST